MVNMRAGLPRLGTVCDEYGPGVMGDLSISVRFARHGSRPGARTPAARRVASPHSSINAPRTCLEGSALPADALDEQSRCMCCLWRAGLRW